MNTHALPHRLRLAFIVAGIVFASASSAANLSMNINSTEPSVADGAYPGSGSTMTTLTDNQTRVIITIAGRDYGNNPTAGSPRWGIRAGTLPGNNSQTGFVVSRGFQPSAPGSTQSASGAAASYISIALSNVQPNTLFQNVSVELQGLASALTTNAWGAVSAGGFADWSVASYSASGRKLTLDLADFTWSGGDPLEIRLYGVTAPNEGAFTTVKISGKLSTIAAVPEPGALLLLGIGIAVICGRRRR